MLKALLPPNSSVKSSLAKAELITGITMAIAQHADKENISDLDGFLRFCQTHRLKYCEEDVISEEDLVEVNKDKGLASYCSTNDAAVMARQMRQRIWKDGNGQEENGDDDADAEDD